MKKISFIMMFFIFTNSYTQIEKIGINLQRIIYNNKVGFTNSSKTVVVVPFIYDLEPIGHRNIARYIAIDTLKVINQDDIVISHKIIDLDNTNYFDSIIKNQSSYSWPANITYDRLDDSWTQPDICEKFFQGGDGFYSVLQNGKYGYINTEGKIVIPFIFDDIIFYKDYYEHGFYKPTYYCVYKDKIYYVTFNNGEFELPDEIKK